MPLSHAQAQVLVEAAHDHARADDWRIAVAAHEGFFDAVGTLTRLPLMPAVNGQPSNLSIQLQELRSRE